MMIVMDDEDRENEGDLVMASEHMTAEHMNFMIKKAGGLVCAPVTAERAAELAIPLMVADNTEVTRCNFTVAVDAKNTTTGISAADRARTVLALANHKRTKKFFRKPGHIFPLVGRKGGVLVRAGHTEASLDLVEKAGLTPCATICEILREDGKMARKKDLERFSKEHGIPIVTIAEIIEWRRKKEKLVTCVARTDLQTQWGKFAIHVYVDSVEGKEHVALIKGKVKGNGPALVRVHSECLTGDIFASQYCDCGQQLHYALQAIQKARKGVVLYMRQEGRGIGLPAKIQAYELQRKGYDTIEANNKLGFPDDLRDYGIGAQILRDLGLCKIKMMTNNPKKVVGLEGYGLEIVATVPIKIRLKTARGRKYLATKKTKAGHLL